MKSNLVFVSYWWGNNKVCENSGYDYISNKSTTKLRYSDIVKRLKRNCERFKLAFYTEYVQFPDSYTHQDKINYKCVFIKKMLTKFKCPVVYLDIDMRLHAAPRLFVETNGYYDFMAFNWNNDPRVSSMFDWLTLETSGGIFYFNNSKPAFRLLDLWETELKKNRNKADDRLLAMAFVRSKAFEWTRFYWLPVEYFYVPQYFPKIPRKSIVISHPMAMSDERKVLKALKTSSRIPNNYDRVVTRKIRHSDIEESCVSHNIIRIVTKNRHKGLKQKSRL